jgi:hypothetical protein
MLFYVRNNQILIKIKAKQNTAKYQWVDYELSEHDVSLVLFST